MSHARRTLGAVLIPAVFCLALWLPNADQPARSLQAAQRQPSGKQSLPQKQEPGSQGTQIVAGEVVTPSLSPALADLPLYQPEYRLDREINPRLSYDILFSEFDSTLCGLTSFYCMAMPGVAQGSPSSLDPLREVVMNRLAYRNFGDHETLVGNFVTDVNGANQGGVRWFELRKSGAGAWILFQEGTYSPTGDNRWMGAIAMDSAGNIALGYNVSSGTVSPSLRYTGRLASDTLGTMSQEDNVLVNGTATNGSNRYGDYAAMSVDPSDDCTFWFTGEWNGASTWSTRIGKFKFDQCGTPDFTISATPANQEICAGANAQYNVAVGNISGYANPVTLSASGNPGSAGFSPNPVTPPGNSTLTLSGAAPGTYNFNVVGTAAGLTVHQTSVGLTVQAAAPAAPALTVPANGSTGQASTPTFTWSAVAGAASYDIQVASDPGFGTIVASATGLTLASYTPASSLAGDTVYYWRVRANNTCGVGPWAATSAFRTGPLVCNTYVSADVPKTIPDNTTVNSIVTIPDAFTITDVNVYLDQLTHTWDGDLLISLLHPDTTTVVLSNRRGSSGDNFTNTVFDQEAATPIASGVAPFTGSFIPDGNLASLYAKGSSGTWTLRVADQASLDTGTLQAWRLNICGTTTATSADYSDLASGYGVAWHTGSGALRLGSLWTADTSFAAGGDNATDDGVAFITNLQPGQPATVRVNVQGTPANGRWLRVWLDWNGNGVFDTTEKAYDGAAVTGNNDLTVAVPLGQTNTAKYRVRLYDSASSPAAPEAIDTGSYGGAAGGEVEDGTSPAPLGVTLASFTAESQAGHILVAWQTLSEVDTAGFNLYRSLSEGGERMLLASVPAQGPGSPAGASYSYQDADVSSGQAYWYWLEHVSLGGATTLAGSVSVIYQAPTAVRLGGIDASPVALAALVALAGAVGLRRRR